MKCEMSKGKNEIKIPETWLYWTYTNIQLLKPRLKTTCNRSLRILETGERNYYEGPDFLNALLEIDGIRMRGDVEFHLDPQDWYRHGHDEDTTYSRVILHAVWACTEGIPSSLENRFPHWVISEALRISIKQWIKTMQTIAQFSLPLYPMFCEQAHLNDRTLEQLSLRRFFRRVDRLQVLLENHSWNDVLYISLAESLGYSRNAVPMGKLLATWPPSRLKQLWNGRFPSETLYWLVWMKAAGLFSTARNHYFLIMKQYPAARAVLQNLEILSHLSETAWHLSGIRPANHPALRLAALATLLYHHQNSSLFHELLHLAMERLPLSKFLSGVVGTLKVPFSEVFSSVLKVYLNHKRLPRYGVGVLRVYQFVVNQLLPLLYLWARRTGNDFFAEYLLELYLEFPSAEQPEVIYRLGQSVIPTLLPVIRKRAALQQGLLEYLYLYRKVGKEPPVVYL